MEVNPKFLISKQESSVSIDVDAKSSLREIHITMPLIECKWCKRKKPCEQFEKYQRKNSYRKTCDNCCQFHCRFCGCSFKSKSRATLPPDDPACEADECKQKSECKPRSCNMVSCIYHRKEINPWILNDMGETTFKPRAPYRDRKFSTQHFYSHCRICSECNPQQDNSKSSIDAVLEPRERTDTLKTSSSTTVNQECSMSLDAYAESSLKETQSSVPMITCKWCKKEKPCKDFEPVRKTQRYHIACNSCRQLNCKFCGSSFQILRCRGSKPPDCPTCRAHECKRKSAMKRINCSNASCIYHTRKINPCILNDNGETTFKRRQSSGHFSLQCRKCQQKSGVKKGT